MAAQMEVILARVSELRSCGGVTSVASPEWTPAFSTCSLTAMHTSSPSAATASTSISWGESGLHLGGVFVEVFLRERCLDY